MKDLNSPTKIVWDNDFTRYYFSVRQGCVKINYYRTIHKNDSHLIFDVIVHEMAKYVNLIYFCHQDDVDPEELGEYLATLIFSGRWAGYLYVKTYTKTGQKIYSKPKFTSPY